MKTFKYNKEQYPFVQLIWELFGCCKLDELHTKWETEYGLFDKPSEDSDTVYHKVFYDRMREGWEEFLNVYKIFINDFVRKQIGQPIIYQKWPTFRVHLPDNLAVGAKFDLALIVSFFDCLYSSSEIIKSGLFFFDISIASLN